MKKIIKSTIIASSALLLSMSTTNAIVVGTTLTFNASELDSFTVQGVSSGHIYTVNDFNGIPGDDTVTIAPAYSDGLTPMSGSAGATGQWNASFNASVEVLLGKTFAALDLSSGVDTMEILAFNDNDDIWTHGLWIQTVDGGVQRGGLTDINGSTAGDPTSALLSYDLSGVIGLDQVTGWGVAVSGILGGGHLPSPGDSYHSSWTAVPEPSTYAMFGIAFLGLGFVGYRKRHAA